MRPCRERIEAEEWLDRPGLSPDQVAASLRDLERVNRLLGGARAVLAHLPPVLNGLPAGAPLRVLDIACGGGDLLRAIAGQAARRGRTVLGLGVDVNPVV